MQWCSLARAQVCKAVRCWCCAEVRYGAQQNESPIGSLFSFLLSFQIGVVSSSRTPFLPLGKNTS